MNSEQAKEILLLYRPIKADRDDPEFAEALAFAENNPELTRWLEEHCAVQQGLRAKFQQIPVPEGLKEQILSERKSHTTVSLKRKLVLAGISAFALLLAFIVFSTVRPHERKTFANFQSRMIRTAARQYPRMDLETADLGQIRQYLGAHQAPLDFGLPAGLAKSTATGCAILQWRGKPVSMMCFNSGRNPAASEADLFLFVINRQDVPNAPETTKPQFGQANHLATASWSTGEKIYVLAGFGDAAFLRKYF